MFATRKARERLRTALLAILIVLTSLVAPYLTFIQKAYEPYRYGADYSYGADYVYTPPWLPTMASIMWIVNLVIVCILLNYLFAEVLPSWINQGQMELPRVSERETVKTLRAVKARLLSELEGTAALRREVPALREEVKQLRAQLAEFRDPPRAELPGYAQPPFIPSNHGAGE